MLTSLPKALSLFEKQLAYHQRRRAQQRPPSFLQLQRNKFLNLQTHAVLVSIDQIQIKLHSSQPYFDELNSLNSLLIDQIYFQKTKEEKMHILLKALNLFLTLFIQTSSLKQSQHALMPIYNILIDLQKENVEVKLQYVEKLFVLIEERLEKGFSHKETEEIQYIFCNLLVWNSGELSQNRVKLMLSCLMQRCKNESLSLAIVRTVDTFVKNTQVSAKYLYSVQKYFGFVLRHLTTQPTNDFLIELLTLLNTLIVNCLKTGVQNKIIEELIYHSNKHLQSSSQPIKILLYQNMREIIIKTNHNQYFINPLSTQYLYKIVVMLNIQESLKVKIYIISLIKQMMTGKQQVTTVINMLVSIGEFVFFKILFKVMRGKGYINTVVKRDGLDILISVLSKGEEKRIQQFMEFCGGQQVENVLRQIEEEQDEEFNQKIQWIRNKVRNHMIKQEIYEQKEESLSSTLNTISEFKYAPSLDQPIKTIYYE